MRVVDEEKYSIQVKRHVESEKEAVCSRCDEVLARFVVASDAVEADFTFKVDCPHCGKDSRPVTIDRRPIVEHGPRTTLIDFEEGDDGITRIRTIRTPSHA